MNSQYVTPARFAHSLVRNGMNVEDACCVADCLHSEYEAYVAELSAAASTAASPPVTVGDLITALAVYAHADTDDYVNARPERDFSALVIRYFLKYPEKLSPDSMRGAWTAFLWDASNQRQHVLRDKLHEMFSKATNDVQTAFLQLYIDQCTWVRRHKAGEFK